MSAQPRRSPELDRRYLASPMETCARLIDGQRMVVEYMARRVRACDGDADEHVQTARSALEKVVRAASEALEALSSLGG